MRNTDLEAPHYAIPSSPLLCHPPLAPVNLTVSYPQTSSAYVPASVLETKFQTKGKIIVLYILIILLDSKLEGKRLFQNI